MIRTPWWTISVVAGTMSLISFCLGYHYGHVDGIALAHHEGDIRVSEHDRIMQRVGVCSWARVMARDIKCRDDHPEVP